MPVDDGDTSLLLPASSLGIVEVLFQEVVVAAARERIHLKGLKPNIWRRISPFSSSSYFSEKRPEAIFSYYYNYFFPFSACSGQVTMAQVSNALSFA